MFLSFFLPVFPISLVCAILRHRLFDMRVMVRQGLRYGVARGLLLSLVPVVGMLLAADLWLHRNQPLSELLTQRRWWYVAVGLVAILLHRKQSVWLQALDRCFFREQFDARQLLRSVAEEARRVHTLERAASLAVSHIDAALHPEFVAILVRLPGEAAFKATAAVRSVPAPVPAASRLIGIVRAFAKPLEIHSWHSGWLTQHLPPGETEFVQKERLEWLFPIIVDPEGPEALLVLGPKRSEEPYSIEDQTLLEALTANLALLPLRIRPADCQPIAGPATPSPEFGPGRYWVRMHSPVEVGYRCATIT